MSRGELNQRSRPLEFREANGKSARRAEDNTVILYSAVGCRFEVALTDSGPAGDRRKHRVILARESDGSLTGSCDCQGFRSHDKPCAHLWALIEAEQHKVVEIPDTKALLDAGPACPTCGTKHPESEVREP